VLQELDSQTSRTFPGGRLLVVGISHRTAPVAVREKLAIDAARWTSATADLPVVLLRTCNRTEVYAWSAGRPRVSARRLIEALASAAGSNPAALEPHLFVYRGAEAMRHLIRLAAGLDSLVIGEHQILGQLRQALQIARAAGQLPPVLDGVLVRAVEGGRWVRHETVLGRHPSLATAAVDIGLRTPRWGRVDLKDRSALVLGAGQMARSAALSLMATGARVTLLNRSLEHAQRVAAELGRGVQAAPLCDLPALAADAFVLVGATAARQPIVDPDLIHARRNGPLLVLDLGLPRNVAPSVRDLPGVVLVDLDDLDRHCTADSAARAAEIERAEALCAAQAEDILRWLRLRAIAPAIVRLRNHAEAIRDAELKRAESQLRDLTPRQHAAVEHMAAALVNKLLHGPTVALRTAAGDGTRAPERVFDAIGFSFPARASRQHTVRIS
jgi:glutamyl-tRNA reductase